MGDAELVIYATGKEFNGGSVMPACRTDQGVPGKRGTIRKVHCMLREAHNVCDVDFDGPITDVLKEIG